tara:strand:- start:979 stop:1404 length:426 start_codon:yes stop_codon:yes gene_type:complete
MIKIKIRKNITAVVIKGNPKYLSKFPDQSRKFYNDIRDFLVSLGYKVSFDEGKPFTQPKKANIWVAHSRAADRLRYAPDGTKTIAFGSIPMKGDSWKTINHPEDNKELNSDQEYEPTEEHFIFTVEMKEELAKLSKGESEK